MASTQFLELVKENLDNRQCSENYEFSIFSLKFLFRKPLLGIHCRVYLGCEVFGVMMEESLNLNRVVKYLLTPVNLETNRSNSNSNDCCRTDAKIRIFVR